MMPTIEPTPPPAELPEEIEAAIAEHRLAVAAWATDEGAYDVPQAEGVLRTAIRAALDDEWDKGFRQAVTDHVELVENVKALRERCERLRTVVNRLMFTDANLLRPHEEIDLLMNLPQSDLADDLMPAPEDVIQ